MGRYDLQDCAMPRFRSFLCMRVLLRFNKLTNLNGCRRGRIVPKKGGIKLALC
jgi:hypothetical protein